MVAALMLAAGCAPADPRASATAAPTIAAVHQRQCSRCHSLPSVGSHPRAYLEAALAPHHKRVHMTDVEWAQMIDYLSAGRGGRGG